MTTILPRTLWYHSRDLKQTRVNEFELFQFSECLVILGEPGMGKTSLLRALASKDEAASCTARQLINRHDPRTLLGNRQLLLIDALDEVASAGQGDAVDLVLRKLGELSYPRFVLSCRVADWRAATMVKAIEEQYGTVPLELHIDPLDRDQQRQLLAAKTNAARADQLLTHFEKFQLDFLGNPQTLELVAALPAKTPLPTTSTALFAMATEQLRLEHKDGKTELASEVALDAAGAAFTALLLTGSSSIVHKASANLDEGELPFAEVEALAGDALQRVIDTRLFSAVSGGFTYWHRRIGEYLAARWLAKRSDSSGKRKRLLAMLRSEGRVPANLRGLHAWLALDPYLAPDVIATDPMGVIEYGDADALTAEQPRLLLDALRHLSRDNPRFVGWSEYRASSLLVSPLQDEVRQVIGDRVCEFGLRKLLIDQVRGENLAPEMRAVLLGRLRDRDEVYAIRERAGEILVSAGVMDWPAELEAIRCQANAMSTRLAFELMDDVGIEFFSDVQIVETVYAYDGLSLSPLPPGEPDNTTSRYWKLARQIPPARLDTLLDLFADYAKALLPRHAGIDEHQLLDLYYELVLMRLAQGAFDPVRLWRWLEHFEGQSSYRRDRAEQLADWFRSKDAVRRAIQHLRLLPEFDPKKFRSRAFELSDACPGLALSQEDVLVLLGALDPDDRRDERWREVLWFVRTSGEEGKVVREAAKPFALHRPDLLEWIDGLAEPQEPKWKRKQEEDARKRRADRAVAHAEHRRDFVENLDGIRRGEFRYVIGPARAYLNHYRDIGDDKPAHERIADWVGDDIGQAAHAGFEAYLLATPSRPNAARIAVSHANSRRWPAADIIVAALAERMRTRNSPFAGLPSERLMAGLFQMWQTRIDSHAKLEGLLEAVENELRARDDLECAIRLYIEPQLKKRRAQVDHLYALMRSDIYRADFKLRLAEDWLKRFPDLPADPESELIDALLTAGHGQALVPLVSGRLAQQLDEERRRNWNAVQVLVDFVASRARLAVEPVELALLWHLRARGGDRRRDDRGSATLSPDQIEWIVDTFRTLFASRNYPSGTSSGDTNPWDATEYLRGLAARLANDVSDEAVAALGRLRDAPVDGYSDAFKIYAAEQRQTRAEHHYDPPTLAEVRAVVEAGQPASAKDLQAVLIEALDEVQARLKGNPLDWYKNFYGDDARHRDEEPCRDALLQMLDGRINGVELRAEDHVADDKRVDIVAQLAPKVIVPVEVKGQWHPKLWTAADEQLDYLYVNDWRAEFGIYLVLWFGPDSMPKPPPPPPFGDRPDDPDKLKAALEASSKAARQGRVAVVVLDLTRPTAP